MITAFVLFSAIAGSLATPESQKCESKTNQGNIEVPDIYYLNLDKSRERRSFMERQLRYYNLEGSARRVRAYLPEDLWIPTEIQVPDECKVYTGRVSLDSASPNRVFVDGHCGRPKNSKRELTVTATHLRALYEATHAIAATNSSSSPYALILEDDLQVAFEVDWKAFFKTVPSDFVMLQLITSNERDVQALYAKFKKTSGADLWHKRLDKNDFWCAGAYIVHKERLRPVIDRIVRALPSSVSPTSSGDNLRNTATQTLTDHARLVMTILAGYSRPCFPKLCCGESFPTQQHDRNSGFENIGKFVVGGTSLRESSTHKACIFAARGYQADHYIFSLARKFTYMITVPLIGGAGVGNVSTLHQEHVNSVHVGAFSRINAIHDELQRGGLPGFANKYCSKWGQGQA